jgi:hypothetical protein
VSGVRCDGGGGHGQGTGAHEPAPLQRAGAAMLAAPVLETEARRGKARRGCTHDMLLGWAGGEVGWVLRLKVRCEDADGGGRARCGLSAHSRRLLTAAAPAGARRVWPAARACERAAGRRTATALGRSGRSAAHAHGDEACCAAPCRQATARRRMPCEGHGLRCASKGRRGISQRADARPRRRPRH